MSSLGFQYRLRSCRSYRNGLSFQCQVKLRNHQVKHLVVQNEIWCAASIGSRFVRRYAALGYNPGTMLLVAMAKEAQRNLQDYSLQDLTDLVWAIAQLGGAQPAEVDQLLDLISDATCSCLQQASQVKVMEACGKTCSPFSADPVVIGTFIGLVFCALIATEA